MAVTLRQPLTLEECQQVRIWRNAPDVLPMLRTGYKTEAEQAEFYRNVICNPDSEHRYYAIEWAGISVPVFEGYRVNDEGETVPAFGQIVNPCIGMGGLTYLNRVPGEAEISLILDPNLRSRGLGRAAVDALLEEAWRLGLTAVVGECYAQGAVGFWAKEIARRPATFAWTWERPA